jgi:cyclase
MTELIPVADGVYAWVQDDGSWWVNNAGAVVDADGVVLIDTCATRRRTELFLAAVAATAGDVPIRLTVNTHLHGDHTYGNVLLPDSTVIVGHEQTREGMLADFILKATPPIWSPTPNWEITELRPPTVVLRDELTLYQGDRRIELRHPGYTAHTPGDVVAWLPAERVLFAGDLVFNHVTPLLLMGSLEGGLRSLEWLAGFDADTVVPGHGPVISGAELPDVLDGIERYYRLVAAVGRAGREAGISPLTAARECDLGEFADWPDAERMVLNLHRSYADAAGVPLDVVAAMTDAVTWHGGLLRCTV